MFKIKPVKNNKDSIPQKECMAQNIIPKYPCSQLLVGKSGSGKTTLLYRLLTDDNLYGGYFHHILYFSPTGDVDDIVKKLKLPKGDVYKDFEPSDIEDVINFMDRKIKKDGLEKVASTHRVALVFDDIISRPKFLKSKEMLRLISACRHSLVSVFLLTQSFTKIPRAMRLNVNAIYLFPSSNSEIKLLVEEFSPPNFSEKSFKKLVKHATKEPYNFLFINNFCQDYKKKFRKNLDVILELKDEDD